MLLFPRGSWTTSSCTCCRQSRCWQQSVLLELYNILKPCFLFFKFPLSSALMLLFQAGLAQQWPPLCQRATHCVLTARRQAPGSAKMEIDASPRRFDLSVSPGRAAPVHFFTDRSDNRCTRGAYVTTQHALMCQAPYSSHNDSRGSGERKNKMFEHISFKVFLFLDQKTNQK